MVQDRILEATDITTHVYGNSGLLEGSEQWGLVYTCAGGFVDVAHMRDMIDLTKFYHGKLLTKNKVGATFKVFAGAKDDGDVVLTKAITNAADQRDVAMSIAYDQGIWHEIVSYWECEKGMHSSSFSPEDIVSNKFGVYIGGKILLATDFNKHAVDEMTKLLGTLGALKRADTERAFTAIEGRWVNHHLGAVGHWRFDFLRKRNFTYDPIDIWTVDRFAAFPPCTGSTGSLPTDFSKTVDSNARSFYTLKFTVPANARAGNAGISGVGRGRCFAPGGTSTMTATSVPTTDFDNQIKVIKDAALLEYLAGYDAP